MDPCDELARAERLRQVVVGADGEPDDEIRLGVAGGEHQHGDRAVALDAPAHLEAVEAGEHEVEDDEIGLEPLRRRRRRRDRRSAISTPKPSLRSRAATAWAIVASSSMTRIDRVDASTPDSLGRRGSTLTGLGGTSPMLRKGCRGVLPEMCGFGAGVDPRDPSHAHRPAGARSRSRTRSPGLGGAASRTSHVDTRRRASPFPGARSSVDADAPVVAAEGPGDDDPVEGAVARIEVQRVGPDRDTLGAERSTTFHPRNAATNAVAGRSQSSVGEPTCSSRPAWRIATRSASPKASS